MPYQLRPGLAYCICEDRPVFLDIDTGRYFTVPSGLCAPFVALVGDENAEIDSCDIKRLLAFRVIEAATSPSVPAVQVRTPTSEVTPLPPRGWSIAAAVAQSLASRRVHHSPLRALLDREAAVRPKFPMTRDESALGRLRGAFDRVAAVFGEADQCFPRSLAFRRLALRHGHSASLVIGVKIDPFAAHCWVQSGTRIDNDSLERVRLFTPIYRV